MSTPQHLPATLHRCWCGRLYAPGASERQRHQTLLGHRPEPPRAQPEPDTTGRLTTDCRRGHHQLCALDGQPGGVIVAPGVTAECACACHRSGAARLSSRCLRLAHSQCTGRTYVAGSRTRCQCACHATEVSA